MKALITVERLSQNILYSDSILSLSVTVERGIAFWEWNPDFNIFASGATIETGKEEIKIEGYRRGIKETPFTSRQFISYFSESEVKEIFSIVCELINTMLNSHKHHWQLGAKVVKSSVEYL